jgi:hypothetical protein
MESTGVAYKGNSQPEVREGLGLLYPKNRGTSIQKIRYY